MHRFRDRFDAGRRLAERLRPYAGRDDLLVLALPRGGVPVAYEVAQGLGAPLDIFIVRKLGMPGHEEFAIGALATGGTRVIDQPVVRAYGIDAKTIDAIAGREQAELERRERLYRGDRPPPPVRGRTIILIDDGLATGASMRAAVAALRQQEPASIIVAVPVAPHETVDFFERLVDEMICLATPEPFHAVGLWYEDFRQTTDEEVQRLLDRSGTSARPR